MPSKDYTLKVGVQVSSNRELKFWTEQPTVNSLICDLFNGRLFRVLSIHAAKELDREVPTMPETVIHLWPAGSVTEDVLKSLRVRMKFDSANVRMPFEDVVLMPA